MLSLMPIVNGNVEIGTDIGGSGENANIKLNGSDGSASFAVKDMEGLVEYFRRWYYCN